MGGFNRLASEAEASSIPSGDGPENLEVEGRMRGYPITSERLEGIGLSIVDEAEKDGRAW